MISVLAQWPPKGPCPAIPSLCLLSPLCLQHPHSPPRPRARSETLRGADGPANEPMQCKVLSSPPSLPALRSPPFPSLLPGWGRVQVFFIKSFIADSQAPAEEGCRSYLILYPTPRLSQHSGQVTEGPVLAHCPSFWGSLSGHPRPSSRPQPHSLPPIIHTATARASF